MILLAKMERNSMAETDMIDDDGLVASYTFVQSMLGKADGAMDFGTSPFWHGWALREAFLAGVAWQRTQDVEAVARRAVKKDFDR